MRERMRETNIGNVQRLPREIILPFQIFLNRFFRRGQNLPQGQQLLFGAAVQLQSDLFQQLILAESIFVKNQIIRPDAQCTGKIHKDGEAELCIGGCDGFRFADGLRRWEWDAGKAGFCCNG